MFQRAGRGRASAVITAMTVTVLAVAALGAVVSLTGADAQARTHAVPQNTAEPRVSGSTSEGSRLTATQGSWNGAPTSYVYQWVRCNRSGSRPDGSDCTVIPGASGPSYVLTRADVGFRLRFRVTAANGDGSTTAASNPTGVIATPQPTRPRNTVRPSISGSPNRDQVLHVNPGTWAGTQPITFSFQWLRCDTGGGNCVVLPGYRDDAYTVREGDVGRRLRVQVVARNAAGQDERNTPPTPVIAGPTGPPGAITLPNGEVSIPATSVASCDRLVVDQVVFAPNPVRSRTEPFTVRVKVKDTRGHVVRDALIFIRSTPLVSVGARDQKTGQDGWVTISIRPEPDFPALDSGRNVQYYVKAYRAGDPVLAGIAGARLVQVGLAP
jgi:hypothetical protein